MLSNAWDQYRNADEVDLLNYMWFGATVLESLAERGWKPGTKPWGQAPWNLCLIDTSMIVP